MCPPLLRLALQAGAPRRPALRAAMLEQESRERIVAISRCAAAVLQPLSLESRRSGSTLAVRFKEALGRCFFFCLGERDEREAPPAPSGRLRMSDWLNRNLAKLRAHPLRAALLVTVGLALAWLTLTKSLPFALAPFSPDLALAFNPEIPRRSSPKPAKRTSVCWPKAGAARCKRAWRSFAADKYS